MKTMTFEISEAYYEFAQKEAGQCGFETAEEYLQALFNGALVAEFKNREEYDNLPPLFPFVVLVNSEDGEPEYVEDPGGGIHHIDLDDGIPF